MKLCYLLLIAAFSADLFAETVTKSSAQFAFPTTVGITEGDNTSLKGAALLTLVPNSADRNAFQLSWSVPSTANKGSIAIFTVAGSMVKTFAITSPYGVIRWSPSADKAIARGIYIATLSYGPYKQNLKIVRY